MIGGGSALLVGGTPSPSGGDGSSAPCRRQRAANGVPRPVAAGAHVVVPRVSELGRNRSDRPPHRVGDAMRLNEARGVIPPLLRPSRIPAQAGEAALTEEAVGISAGGGVRKHAEPLRPSIMRRKRPRETGTSAGCVLLANTTAIVVQFVNLRRAAGRKRTHCTAWREVAASSRVRRGVAPGRR